MAKRKRGGRSTAPGRFDPEDVRNVKHTRIGVWDLYEEKHPELARIPGSSRLETVLQMSHSIPYVWQMIKDITSIPRCWIFLSFYMIAEIVEIAVEKRDVDKQLLLHVAAGRIACTIASRLLQYARGRLALPLNMRIKQYYSTHIYHSMARLDVPTYEDPAVQRQLEAAWSTSWNSSVAWETIQMTSTVFTIALRLISQLSVLFAVLRDQRDGPLLAVLSFSQSVFQWYIWAATTKNTDYVRMQGLKQVINDASHRKEVVAGNMSEYMTSQFRDSTSRVGDDAGDFHEMRRLYAVRDRLTFASILKEPLRELPQIVFTLRAVQYPASIPLSLASLTLINQASSSFSSSLFQFFGESFSLAEQYSSVRKLYEIAHIPNRILDGKEPFPENSRTLDSGILIEFRNVSFKYTDAEKYALHNVSFKLNPGQLCVIVGVNGSGKSTILKLIARIYDPLEGEILLDGRDIRTLKLVDLRRAMSMLFQDYTHFPLSIKENIGLGDPTHALDDDKIREAARLGGAEEFVNRLPDGFDTYLDRPVHDYYSSLPEGTTSLFGRPVDYSHVRGAGRMQSTSSATLSGGQMQRLAVSRTFMRSLISGSEPSVGLLLFDEPSASLDPTAEHGESVCIAFVYMLFLIHIQDLFERLRALRGNKTMVFSSHRFGNLTRHADLILYMNDSVIEEEGTHDELLKKGGHYAKIWNLQAKAFL
ncbi:hypothetical protein SERLADRAFT_453452 [Serpula lacrymans var. lacrymans S7.9]|uniref:ABC transporter domain-containing protein n=1 Tax=Serpula lacrymans var. lacrymans (strain S7.9) TaxID=578457 RepID=F8PB40_SERL9|nr:uncharacterized protein SERLADRAFT_453452 [Serpula lacrymans var. lacrymans S7.9]EGO19480.1 hypothetical protein SERLADRAFT_453452 [Serpula lacrymans var. lacrymans S7.9]